MTINSSSLNIHTFLNIATAVTGIIPTKDALYVCLRGLFKFREHQQKTFVKLSRFWPLRGWGGLGESVKKENLWQKSFLKKILNEVLKICEKWYLLKLKGTLTDLRMPVLKKAVLKSFVILTGWK